MFCVLEVQGLGLSLWMAVVAYVPSLASLSGPRDVVCCRVLRHKPYVLGMRAEAGKQRRGDTQTWRKRCRTFWLISMSLRRKKFVS